MNSFELLQAYHKNETIIIKVSGAEIYNPDFSVLVQNIREAINKTDVSFVLVFGGGLVIDQEYLQNTGNIRAKGEHGVHPTSSDVLQNGVLPSYASLREYLAKLFADSSAVFWEPSDILCATAEEGDYTGKIESIQSTIQNRLTVAGFVGENISGEPLNVNADDIAEHIALWNHEQGIAGEVIFCTPTGRVVLNNKRVPLLTADSLQNSIDSGAISGGMK